MKQQTTPKPFALNVIRKINSLQMTRSTDVAVIAALADVVAESTIPKECRYDVAVSLAQANKRIEKHLLHPDAGEAIVTIDKALNSLVIQSNMRFRVKR